MLIGLARMANEAERAREAENARARERENARARERESENERERERICICIHLQSFAVQMNARMAYSPGVQEMQGR